MYKLFYENELNGMPPMRPLWMQFPEDTNTFAIDDSYLLGDALLVHPIQEKGSTSVEVYFPGDSSTAWLHIGTHHVYSGAHSHSVQADINSIPIFQRSGTIVPKRLLLIKIYMIFNNLNYNFFYLSKNRERIRRSALLTVNDPLSLDIFLDSSGSADGGLYLDDGQTFNYKSGQYIYGKLSYGKKVLNYQIIDGKYESKSWLERVTIFGYPSKPVKIQWINGEKSAQLPFKYDDVKRILVIRKPGLAFTTNWQIKIT
jgi:alpha 1,3-glucosidase